MTHNNDPREHRDFPCTDDAGNGFGETKYELDERQENKCGYEDLDYEVEDEFTPCSGCDGHDACEDFGCAIKSGIISEEDY